MKRAVAIVSGGMDSVTLAYLLHADGYQLHLVSFDYGQRHRKELAFAQLCAERLGARHSLIDLQNLTPLLGGSALTDTAVTVPDGYYSDETMRITVVPNRNAIMLSIAVAAAVVDQASVVATGVHGGDHFIYPDCRPEFITAFDQMAKLATVGHAAADFHLYTPFVHLRKQDIVLAGVALGVPYADTWSCYKGGDIHCGTCGTCTERKEAFLLAGVPDPTTYLSSYLFQPGGEHVSH